MNRRELIRNVATGTVTLFVVPTFMVSCEEDMPEPDNNQGNNGDDNTLSLDLASDAYSKLNTAGASVIVSNIIVFNTGNEFIALSSVCTHSGCAVTYDSSSGNLPCPCHGSLFSTSGSVLNGPADSPLKKYTVTKEGDVLKIQL